MTRSAAVTNSVHHVITCTLRRQNVRKKTRRWPWAVGYKQLRHSRSSNGTTGINGLIHFSVRSTSHPQENKWVVTIPENVQTPFLLSAWLPPIGLMWLPSLMFMLGFYLVWVHWVWCILQPACNFERFSRNFNKIWTNTFLLDVAKTFILCEMKASFTC
jgi:hypothetical protein